MLLEVQNLTAGYGEVQVLWGVDLFVDEGELVALIGSNGVGKTTLMYSVAGVLPAWGGAIRFAGEEITGLTADRVVRRGLALVPQGRRLFKDLTVLDNLLMGAYHRQDDVQAGLETVFGLFPILRDRARQQAGTLSGGEQQMCAIARGLMARPRLLCIDELSLGLAPVVIERIMIAVDAVRRQGTTVLLVEQDVETALEIADRVYVMENGRIELSGTSQEVREDERVRTAYLGL